MSYGYGRAHMEQDGNLFRAVVTFEKDGRYVPEQKKYVEGLQQYNEVAGPYTTLAAAKGARTRMLGEGYRGTVIASRIEKAIVAWEEVQ